MSEIRVNVGAPYSIFTESGLLDRLGKEIKKVTGAHKVLVVTDTNVEKLYLSRAVEAIACEGYDVYTFVFEAGECSKTAKTYLDIISALGERGFKRTDAVVALGGGVVGDIAGFAAATYMRGIDVIQVPTTLLAMIDSSVGGKTGVDLPFGKNLLGAFHQPKLVAADISLLSTLPEREWINGIGEGIKYACLDGGKIARIMSDSLNGENICEFVTLCAAYKADIVARDEKEGGLRRLLNLGHTVGHAIEKQSDFAIAHGLAVAYGIGVMLRAAYDSGELPRSDFEFISAMLEKAGVFELPEITDEIIAAVAMDKKTEGKDEISAVKIAAVGKCEVCKMTLAQFEKYIRL